MKKAICYQRVYAIELTGPEMVKLLEDDRAQTDIDNILSNAMDDIEGIHGTDYAGLTGHNIVYTVDDENDQKDLHDHIAEMVKSRIR